MSAWEPNKMRVELARLLREIVKLCGDLKAEGEFHADDKDIPGGAATVMLGPSADPEAWNYMQISAIMGRTDVHGAFEFKGDPTPPLLVLATWEDAIRDELDTPTTAKATIEGAAAYIGSSINWMLDTDENGDINFLAVDDLANALRSLKAHLENVLKAGHRNDTGAPCIECGKPLVKLWREAKEYDQWECRDDECDDFKKPVSAERYKNALRSGHLALADRLNASDMLEAYRIKVGTLQGWASKGLVKKRGKDHNGRVLYDVEQAKAMRDGKGEDDAA